MPRPRRLVAVVTAAGLAGLAIGFWAPGPDSAATSLASVRGARRSSDRRPGSFRG